MAENRSWSSLRYIAGVRELASGQDPELIRNAGSIPASIIARNLQDFPTACLFGYKSGVDFLILYGHGFIGVLSLLPGRQRAFWGHARRSSLSVAKSYFLPAPKQAHLYHLLSP